VIKRPCVMCVVTRWTQTGAPLLPYLGLIHCSHGDELH
jgi:hypothetical protein